MYIGRTASAAENYNDMCKIKEKAGVAITLEEVKMCNAAEEVVHYEHVVLFLVAVLILVVSTGIVVWINSRN